MYESKDKMVSHPSHYQGANGMEVIDVIENFTCDLTGKEATNTGQIIKYILRWKKKNGLQDLEKTMWYLQGLIEHVRNKEAAKPGLRCAGCVFNGDDCLNPNLCVCDSSGKYTGYTLGPDVKNLKTFSKDNHISMFNKTTKENSNSCISIIDTDSHRVIEIFEKEKYPIVWDDRTNFFTVLYLIRDGEVKEKIFDKTKVTYSLSTEKEN